MHITVLTRPARQSSHRRRVRGRPPRGGAVRFRHHAPEWARAIAGLRGGGPELVLDLRLQGRRELPLLHRRVHVVHDCVLFLLREPPHLDVFPKGVRAAEQEPRGLRKNPILRRRNIRLSKGEIQGARLQGDTRALPTTGWRGGGAGRGRVSPRHRPIMDAA